MAEIQAAGHKCYLGMSCKLTAECCGLLILGGNLLPVGLCRQAEQMLFKTETRIVGEMVWIGSESFTKILDFPLHFAFVRGIA